MAATTKKPSTTRAIVAGRQNRQSELPPGKEPAAAVSSKHRLARRRDGDSG